MNYFRMTGTYKYEPSLDERKAIFASSCVEAATSLSTLCYCGKKG